MSKIMTLFTGGGLVPKSLLSFQNIKFIHFHPRYLPIVKGADCTLWSSLIFGRTAATRFIMSVLSTLGILFIMLIKFHHIVFLTITIQSCLQLYRSLGKGDIIERVLLFT